MPDKRIEHIHETMTFPMQFIKFVEVVARHVIRASMSVAMQRGDPHS